MYQEMVDHREIPSTPHLPPSSKPVIDCSRCIISFEEALKKDPDFIDKILNSNLEKMKIIGFDDCPPECMRILALRYKKK